MARILGWHDAVVGKVRDLPQAGLLIQFDALEIGEVDSTGRVIRSAHHRAELAFESFSDFEVTGPFNGELKISTARLRTAETEDLVDVEALLRGLPCLGFEIEWSNSGRMEFKAARCRLVLL